MLKTSTMFNLIELNIGYIMKSQDMCIHELAHLNLYFKYKI
jgi:hypothetical protein